MTWHGKEPMLRMLQVDELRRAMGFPKQYRFEHGARRDKIKMMGNGGCPRGDRADEAPDLFEPALPLGVDEPPAVLDGFAPGVSLGARDGELGLSSSLTAL